jgi:GntP family gluconate:H+ symporter
VSKLLSEGAEKAGGILIIIGAGGAFGAVLAATKIGDHFSQAVSWVVSASYFHSCLRRAQNCTGFFHGGDHYSCLDHSAVITTAGIRLGARKINLRTVDGRGSMMISHSNDAYFWVISKFSGLICERC